MKPEPRRAVPLSKGLPAALAQLEKLMRQVGMIPVEMTAVEWELHHAPELSLRDVDPVTGQHVPHQHDERFLVWLPKATHRVVTNGNGATTRGSSKGELAKTRHLVEARVARGEVAPDDPSIAPWAPDPNRYQPPQRALQGRGLPGRPADKPSSARSPSKCLPRRPLTAPDTTMERAR